MLNDRPVSATATDAVFIRADASARYPYAATKGAIDALVMHFAATLGARGVCVNAIAPGVVDTDFSGFTKTEAVPRLRSACGR